MTSETPSITPWITPEQIAQRVRELGEQIWADSDPDRPTLLVGVLKGSAFFLADLARAVPGPVDIGFITLSSWQGMRSTGVVRIISELEDSTVDRDVVVVEDIVDTGHTLRFLLDNTSVYKARRLRVCAFLDKPSQRAVDVPIDYVGFTIPNLFVVGYGMDYNEQYRSLPYVGLMDETDCPPPPVVGRGLS